MKNYLVQKHLGTVACAMANIKVTQRLLQDMGSAAKYYVLDIDVKHPRGFNDIVVCRM